MSIILLRLAAALCFVAVALGAFGAHALRPIIDRHGLLDVWNKAVLYHFLHGLGVVYGLARLVTRSAPVQRVAEPWPGAGRARAWPTRVARA